MTRAVFFDRDGTLGGRGGYCHPEEFEFFEFAPQAVKLVRDADFLIVVVTNQSRIAHGTITLEQVLHSFERLQKQLESLGTQFDAWYVCSHDKSAACDCKKPATGLFLRAARDHAIDLRQSFVVGDSGFNDIQAGKRVGAHTVLVRTGEGVPSLEEYRPSWANVEPDFVAEDVLEAAHWIVAQ